MNRDAFTVGWVCALALELVASRMMLDHEFTGSELDFDQTEAVDTNSYTFGKIGGHNVVIVCLPAGVYGNASAAAVAKEMLQRFTNIRFGVMVGVGGGFPTPENDIRLGDVVVSQPVREYGGIVQYDFGKMLPDKVFQTRGPLNKPPRVLLGAVQKLRASHDMHGSQLLENLRSGFERYPRLEAGYSRPEATEGHLHEQDGQEENSRPPRLDSSGNLDHCPKIHYGLIATGNSVIASSEERDRIQELFSAAILCFEMEAAGLMDEFPCLVIRGISDYAVSNKGDTWQKYAAATAAAYAKELLDEISVAAVRKTSPANDSQDQATEAAILELLSSNYQDDKNGIRVRPLVEGTCEWFFTNTTFVDWRDRDESTILWMTAGPGCGKSVLSKALIDKGHLDPFKKSHVCYFFFKEGLDGRTDGRHALSAILHQLFSSCDKELTKLAFPAYKSHGAKLTDQLSEMWNILVECARRSTSYITCIIDALDECESHARGALQSLLHTFYSENTTKSSHEIPRLKFLITSRPYYEITNHFTDVMDLGVCIQLDGNDYVENIAKDINLVINYEVPRMLQGCHSTTQQSVIQKLRKAENRTYLWLYLTLDIIRQNPTSYIYSSDFDQIFDELPDSLNEAYEKILERIGYVPRARKILQIVIAAQRNLTLREMNVALAISEQRWLASTDSLQLMPSASVKTVLENTCGLFIQVFDSEVHLIHQTAREYLTTPSDDSSHPWKGSISSAVSNAFLCDILLKCNVMTGPRLSLSRYASKYWITHWKLSMPDTRASMTEMATLSLCGLSAGQLTSHQLEEVLSEDLCYTSRANPFDEASTCGLDDIFIHMLKMALRTTCSQSQMLKMVTGLVTKLRLNSETIQIPLYFQALCNCLASRPDAQYFRDLALETALAGKRYKIAEKMVENGGKIKAWSLHFAASLYSWSIYENPRSLKLLLDSGLERQYRDCFTATRSPAVLIEQLESVLSQANLDPSSMETNCNLVPGHPIADIPRRPMTAEANSIYWEVSSLNQTHPSSIRTRFQYPGEYYSAIFAVSFRIQADKSGEKALCVLEKSDFRLEIEISPDTSEISLYPWQRVIALEVAVRNGWPSIVPLVLSPETGLPAETLLSALSLAAKLGEKEIIQFILGLQSTVSLPLSEASIFDAFEPVLVSGVDAMASWLLELLPTMPEDLAGTFLIKALKNQRQDLARTILFNAHAGTPSKMIDFLDELGLRTSNTSSQETRELPGLFPSRISTPTKSSRKSKTLESLEQIKITLQLCAEFRIPIDTLSLLRDAYEGDDLDLFQLLAERDIGSWLAIEVIAVTCRTSQSYMGLMKTAKTLRLIDAGRENSVWAEFDRLLTEARYYDDLRSFPPGPLHRLRRLATADDAHNIRNAILRVAMSGNSTNLLDYVLSQDMGTISLDQTLVQEVSASNRMEILPALLQAGVDPSLMNPELVRESRATRGGTVDLEKQHRESLGSELCAACYHGRMDLVEKFVDCGIDINATSGFFGTALCAASYRGHYDIVVFLLSKGADADLPGRQGSTVQYALRDEELLQIPEAYRVPAGSPDNAMMVSLLKNWMTKAVGPTTDYSLSEHDFYDSDEVPDWGASGSEDADNPGEQDIALDEGNDSDESDVVEYTGRR